MARGASVDLPDSRGWTPLFWAAFNGHADIVSFLIGRANHDVRNSDGEWPLFWAAYKGHTSVVRHLRIGGAKRNQLDADGHDELRLAQMLGGTTSSPSSKDGAPNVRSILLPETPTVHFDPVATQTSRKTHGCRNLVG
ncbi:ankyrin repeat domain-containing protein [Aromatoleum evansii]|uniref:Ankyrin repeat domain-containing protein n=1 Tax=Aromatoleum evansii TaxID=59406 RepID=A0ABZ1ATV7_AROEV|nr:ankyrin repeat domain-containing protein [Aromatoleum toluclasticum]WRL48669.1 ankyrin repeat domain-containing protein [Aromatoleum evansii]